ncbi:hypothetical protein CEXT_656301 [Caerostris extrusa]|uniref:Uncharacterized protein n=1 Tax=Caerostris extrusa TaxID=172846 RepID=A0AAV4U137_CAEEX|nr:hypothetical protein CEXT_656301 [Caerostris extrusa]
MCVMSSALLLVGLCAVSTFQVHSDGPTITSTKNTFNCSIDCNCYQENSLVLYEYIKSASHVIKQERYYKFDKVFANVDNQISSKRQEPSTKTKNQENRLIMKSSGSKVQVTFRPNCVYWTARFNEQLTLYFINQH